MTIVTDRPSRPSRPSTPPVGELQGPTLSRVMEGSGKRARRGWRLGTRLFAGNALFLGLTLLLVVAFASWEANRRAERRIRDAVEPVPRIVRVYLDAQQRALLDQVRGLADSVGTKALLSLAGTDAAAATFHDSAVDLARRLGPGAAVFLFDPRGVLLARSDRLAGEEAGRDFASVSWVARPLYTGEATAAFILEIRRRRSLSLVAAAPVYQGQDAEKRINGIIAVTAPVAEPRMREIAGLVSGETLLLANVARRGQPLALAVLAGSPQLRGVAPDALLDGATREMLFVRGQDVAGFDFTAGGERYTGAAVAVKTGGGEPIAALLAALPKSAELAAFRALRGSVVLIGLVALAVSLPLTFAFARRTSRPIEQLAAGAEALRLGRLDVELPRARDAEVKTLARAFGALVIELEEKRALERLLAQTRRSDTADLPVTIADEADADSIVPGQLMAHRYHIKALIGGGGMGRVFRAHDLDLDEEVAIKILSPRVLKRDSTLQLLRQEIKMARAITHPNVVRVHDLGESGGLRFLTMEFVSGTTLRRLISQRGHLDLMPGLQVAKQLCRGLAAVHVAGMVHGDVKPENVMVLPNGLVKLMDFGVARRAGLEAAESGTVAGTPTYMSPEHARGAELDERSDLYAVGVVMFELFTGQPPFDADEYSDLLRLHLYAPPPDPRELRPELPQTLAEVILFCLAKNRLERPGSAAELDQGLMRVRM